MKRTDALSRMVEGKRISQKLSEDIQGKLASIRKSHEVVLAKTLAQLGDLGRGDAEIDEFVSMVTLQYLAGEMNDDAFEKTLGECDRIKVVNGKEILDIKRTLGMGTGDAPVEIPHDESSRGAKFTQERPKSDTPQRVDIEPRAVVSAAPQQDGRQQIEIQTPRGGNGGEARVEPAASPAPERYGPGIRELDPSLQSERRPDVVDLGNEAALQEPVRIEKLDAVSSQISGPARSDSSLGETSTPAPLQPQDSIADTSAEETQASSSETKSSEKPVLGQQVSE